MADIFDQIAASVSAPETESAAATGDIFDQIAASVQVKPRLSAGETFAGGMTDLLDKFTLGGGDEVVAAGNAGLDFIMGGGDTYDSRLAQARDLKERYAEENPYSSMAANAGALLMPLPGILNAAKGGNIATQTAKGVAAGGVLGGASGFLSGEGSAGQRARGAMLGGGLGAAAGAAAMPLMGLFAAGTRAAADKAAQYGITPGAFLDDAAKALGESPEAVRGSAPVISQGGGAGFTPEELFLAKQLKNTPMSKVAAAAEEMAATQGDEIPLFLPEALKSPKVERNAKFIANYEPSLEFAQDAIRARTAGAETRATSLFDAASPVQDIYTGATSLTGAADDIIKAAEEQRKALVGPLYQKAYDDMPLIGGAPNPRGYQSQGTENAALKELLETDQVLQRAIKSVKKTANNAGLPDNSTRILVQARGKIGDEIETAIKNGQNTDARNLSDTYNRLNSILHNENPALLIADEAYQGASETIGELSDTFLSSLRKMSPDKADNIGQIFNLPASRIEQLRNTFATAGKLDQWNAGVRSYLQKAAEGSREGQNFTLKIAGSTLQKDKLRAALGDKADDIIKGLDYENRFFEGKNKYFAGSPTQPLAQEQGKLEQTAGFFKTLTSPSEWAGALTKLFDGDIPDELAQNMARIYFDPRRGGDALQKIVPLLEDYARNRTVTEAASGAGRYTATRAPTIFGGALESFAPSRTPAYQAPSFATGQPPATPTGVRSSASASSGSKGSFPYADDRSVSTGSQSKGPGGFLKKTSFAAAPAAAFDPVSEALDSLTKGDRMAGEKRPIAAVEAEIDQDPYYSALYEAESSRNPTARPKDPKTGKLLSSAKGGFQFLDGTAKAVGLEDPDDLEQAFEKVQELTDQHRKRFGDDPELLYSAHYLGATVMNKWISGKPLTRKEQAQVDYLQEKALPRFLRIYNKVRKRGQVEA